MNITGQQSVRIFLTITVLMISTGCFKKPEQKDLNSSVSHEASFSHSIDQALAHENVVPVAIIGSGPAGLSASLYIARAGMKAFVFAGPMPCGQLTETTFIENWPGRDRVLGLDLMTDIKKQAESFGATIIHDTVTNVDFSSWPFALTTEEGRSFKAMAIILATGATPRTLKVSGESQYWGKGVTTCAVCDAPFFKDKEVVIAGGGDSAAEMVFELAPYVKKVTMLVRKDSLKAAVAMQKKVESFPNAQILYHKEITEIFGNGQTVTGATIYDNATKQSEKWNIDGVFLAIGHDPNNSMLKGGLQLDEHGYVVMQGRSQQASVPGVFAAGEIQDPYYRQAIVAAGEGVKAALDAAGFLYEIGFNSTIGQKLDQNFFEHFSDVKQELKEIESIDEMNEFVIQGKGLVVLDFYSTECPGCMRMLPVLEGVASKLAGKVTIIKTNYAKIQKTIWKALWHTHNIKVRRLPSMIIFKDGVFLEMSTELYTKPELLEYLQKFL